MWEYMDLITNLFKLSDCNGWKANLKKLITFHCVQTLIHKQLFIKTFSQNYIDLTKTKKIFKNKRKNKLDGYEKVHFGPAELAY